MKAVEASSIAVQAKRLVAANDVIKVISGKIEELSLPEQVIFNLIFLNSQCFYLVELCC